MPLLKPPEPQVPRRKYYLRIEESLAPTMERYAEFLGATTIDHVISQALEFVFRKDADFKEWLTQYPQPVQLRTGSQNSEASTGAAHLRSPPAGFSEGTAPDENQSASSAVVSDLRGHRALFEDFLHLIERNTTPICAFEHLSRPPSS